MFHVELRQFPHQTRAFNLSRAQLDARILRPWLSGDGVQLNDRQWAPDRARMTIYEGPELTPDQLGLGRGWANVTRRGEDVTARLLAEVAHPPPVADLKRAVLGLCAGGLVPIAQVLELANKSYPGARVSERIGLCEQAVWELLHEGGVVLVHEGETIASDEWRGVLLSWQAWSQDGVSIARA